MPLQVCSSHESRKFRIHRSDSGDERGPTTAAPAIPAMNLDSFITEPLPWEYGLVSFARRAPIELVHFACISPMAFLFVMVSQPSTPTERRSSLQTPLISFHLAHPASEFQTTSIERLISSFNWLPQCIRLNAMTRSRSFGRSSVEGASMTSPDRSAEADNRRDWEFTCVCLCMTDPRV